MRPVHVIRSLLAAALAGCAACAGWGPGSDGISDARFASLIVELSGPGASFESDNLVSNEISYLDVTRQLEGLVEPGGAYLGVGPAQNFTYIALTRPEIAFVVDIRRENMLHHLLFKAIFEMAATPAEFLSIELSRPLPPQAAAGLPDLVAALDATAPDEAAYTAHLAVIQSRIRERYLPTATQDDLDAVARILRVFFERGLDVRYEQTRFDQLLERMEIPSYRNFLLAVDREGAHRNFLANADDFAFVKELQRRNRVIPVVGDFAGDVALPAVGRFLAQRDRRVSVFYLSNVEYYLLPQHKLKAYAANLAQLPHDDRTLLIRSMVDLTAHWHPASRDGRDSVTVLQALNDFVERAGSGRGYFTYPEIIYDSLPADSGSEAHAPAPGVGAAHPGRPG